MQVLSNDFKPVSKQCPIAISHLAADDFVKNQKSEVRTSSDVSGPIAMDQLGLPPGFVMRSALFSD